MRSLWLLTAVLAAFGCTRGQVDAVVLRFWAMGREGEVVARMMPEFERRNPGVRVRLQQIPWSAAHEKLLTAYVGDAMPDVFQAGNTWLPELDALGAVEPLDAYLGRSATVRADEFFPGIWDTNVVDGKTLGIPWYVDTRLLFYRSDLLAAAGFAEPPRTWPQWLQAMQAIKARAGAGRYAMLVPLREWQLPVILALQQGAELLRDGERYGNFRSAEFARAFDFYLGLFRSGLAPAGGETQVANVYQDFAAGFFAFYLSGPWNLGEFAARLPSDLQDDWSTAALPAPPGEAVLKRRVRQPGVGAGAPTPGCVAEPFQGTEGSPTPKALRGIARSCEATPGAGSDATGSEVASGYPGVSLAGGSSLALFSGSPHKDAAWNLVEYLSEAARHLELYELTGDLPARRTVWEEPELAANRRADAFKLQLQAVRSTPKIPEWEQIAQKISHYAEAAVRGSLTAEQALAALDGDVDRILEKRRWLLSQRPVDASP